MLALQYRKSIPRYAWVRLMGRRFPRAVTGRGSSLRLTEMPAPQLPAGSWARVRPLLSGICGSDLAVLSASSSLYLSALTSFPFVPGHEVVGEVAEVGPEVSRVRIGDRVVLEPALGCAVRGISQPCRACREGHYANCEAVTEGVIATGVQTGYCRDTGGGWGAELVAHESQLHNVPEELPHQVAVLAEPLSCAVHGVLQAEAVEGSMVRVLGAGTMGLLTIAALNVYAPGASIIAVAKHPHQMRLAESFGADDVISPGRQTYDRLAELTGGTMHPLQIGKPAVVGGVDITYECVGVASSLEDALRWTRAQGTLVMVGMPSVPKVDLAPFWYKEVRLLGSYGYGLETVGGKQVRTFDLALQLLARPDWTDRMAALVSHQYPLRRYKEAIAAALQTGRSGAVKTVFDLVQS